MAQTSQKSANTSIQSAAMLVQLQISQMGTSGKDQITTNIANKHLRTSADAGFYKKHKITRSQITAITRAVSNARNVHKNYTSAWDFYWRLLPSSLTFEYTEKMRAAKQLFETAVNDFITNWPVVLADTQARLGPIFNPSEYPQQQDLHKLYDFKTHFRPIPDASHYVLDVEQDVLDDLKQQLEDDHNQAIEEMTRSVWEKLYTVVAHMAERLDDPKKKFKNSLVENITSLLAIMPELNVTQDVDLDNMVNEVKNGLTIYTPGQLRQDLHARKKTASKAKDISDKMGAYMGLTV